MKPKNTKTHIISAAVLTAATVGAINLCSALIAYSFLMPSEPNLSNESLITDDSPKEAEKSEPASQHNPGIVIKNNMANSSTSAPVAVREKNSPIIVGQAAQPTNIITDDSGQVHYQWCSGINPNLEDAVCEAIISIASNPTASNPHLSEKAIKSLSLLPSNISLTMHEMTWTSDVSHYGTMIITAHTSTYGDVDLKIALEKINGVWVIQDGYLA